MCSIVGDMLMPNNLNPLKLHVTDSNSYTGSQMVSLSMLQVLGGLTALYDNDLRLLSPCFPSGLR